MADADSGGTQEFKQKVQRGSAMGNHKTLALFQSINKAATDNCTQAFAL